MQINQRIIEENEIDLRELFLTIWKNKVFILVFTFIVTLIAVLYVGFKPYTPIYQGKVLLEMGEVYNKNNDSELIDKPINLSKIIENKFKVNGLSVNIPRGTNNLLELTVINHDKKLIVKYMNEIYSYIIQRHENRTKYYEKFSNTKKIGDILINNEPINKLNKKLIVIASFLLGLLFSIFIIFFIEFIKSFKSR
ncbi:Wzz/FepE/Etk N-terminal domain-containing protein [Halarcobacter sp.]|uniref:Wzz/FepE/Etk N-terminal domain-containing protein n=1 Tax=Halarcobacter sp. TaxID=2321133 RepID=UPI003A910D8E